MIERDATQFSAVGRERRAAARERGPRRRSEEVDREYVEALLEGVPLPATNEVLVKYGKREDPKEIAHELRRLSFGRYSTRNEAG